MAEVAQPEPETAVGATALDLDPEALAPLAWTLDEHAGEPHHVRHRWRWLLAVGALVAALGAVATAVFGLGGYRIVKAAVPSATAPSASSIPAAPTSAFSALTFDPVLMTTPLPEAQRDGVYLDTLNKGHIPTTPTSVQFGRNACAQMKQGVPSLLVDAALANGRPDLSALQRHFVLKLIVGVYCPELMVR